MVLQLCNLPLVHCFGVVFFATEVLGLVNGLVQVTSLHTQGQWYGTSTGKEVFRTWQITYVELTFKHYWQYDCYPCLFHHKLATMSSTSSPDGHCLHQRHSCQLASSPTVASSGLPFCEFQQLMLLHEWSLWCIYHGSSTFWWVGWGDLYIAYTDACPVIYMYKYDLQIMLCTCTFSYNIRPCTSSTFAFLRLGTKPWAWGTFGFGIT